MQLDAVENDEKFRYDSPLDIRCPLGYLKFILMRLETMNPEYFKDVMSKLAKTEIDNLLVTFNYSEMYVAKLRDTSSNPDVSTASNNTAI